MTKTIRLYKTGGPEVLQWEEVAVGEPGEGQARIRHTAIGVNFIEELEQNIKWAIETQPFNDDEMNAIIKMGETMVPTWSQRYG